MGSLPRQDSPDTPETTPIHGRSPHAGTIDVSRLRLAELIGRLLARRWLRNRHEQRPDRRDLEEPARAGPARRDPAT
jgi:hypothetical protein